MDIHTHNEFGQSIQKKQSTLRDQQFILVTVHTFPLNVQLLIFSKPVIYFTQE